MKTFISKTVVLLLAFLLGIAAFGPYHPAALAAASPNLTVQEITLSPAEPALGDKVTITVAVKNLGDAPAVASLTTCYIDDSVLETKTTSAIEPGITTTITFNWTAAGGAHVIKAIADAGNTISESDENNNARTHSLTTLAPDLVVQSIRWQPQNAARGDNIVISITILNLGNIKSRYSDINFYIDGAARGSRDLASIEPGNTITITYNWIVLEGSHTFKTVADENNNVIESNESNNVLSTYFGTLPPDLMIDGITWAPLNPSKDDIVSFTATVRNMGAGRAGQSYLGYYIDDAFIDMVQIPVLEAGDYYSATFTWKATLNAQSVKVTADYYSMVNESNEDNNTLEASLQAVPPDLIMTKVLWTPVDPAAGDNMTFTIHLKNQGGGRADPSRMIVNIDAKPAIYIDCPAIEAGAEAVVYTTWIAESGEHNIHMQADYMFSVIESKEDNNDFSTSFSVSPPDLIISQISFSPEKPSLDETVTFSVIIMNQGKGKASLFNVSHYIDDAPQSMAIVDSLGSGASTTLTWNWKITNGRHVFKAVVDLNDAILEKDEKNNTETISIAPNMADLAITNVTWEPADIPVGQDTTFVITIENLGGLTAEPSRLVYYVDETIAGFNDIQAVRAGEKITQSFTWAASDGQHNISIVVDSKDQVMEIDEANNTVIVKIPPPDLQVQKVKWSPQNAMSGDVVTITASIINTRGSKTQESNAECYIDNTSIGIKSLQPLNAGETAEISFEWTAKPGTHIFRVVADPNKAMMETDETNNEASVSFAATSPDLSMGNIKWAADSHSNSKELDFTITVKNSGSCDSGVFSLQYSFDNSPATVKEMRSIPGGGTADFTAAPILSEGAHTLKIILDIKGQVSELNKENNTIIYPFSTIAPDLIIRSITWAPITAIVGDNVTISTKVENTGLAKASGTRISLVIDGAQVSAYDIPEIDGGSTTMVDFAWKALEGEHQIEVKADSLDKIQENNETNNARSRTISFAKPEAPGKKTPIITLNANTGGGLLETWWWVLLLAGGALALGILYTTIRNMRKK